MIYLTSVNESKVTQSNEELEALLVRMAREDMQAFHTLYEQTKKAVYAFALSVLKNAHDAEDVLQDTFVSLYHAAGDYQPNGKPMAWILTVARNHCMQKFRRQKKQADMPQEDWENWLGSQDMALEDRMLVRQCMKLLSNEERQILVLHAVAGFKHREIAELTQLALPTVLSKYHRAIQKLRKHILQEEEQA